MIKMEKKYDFENQKNGEKTAKNGENKPPESIETRFSTRNQPTSQAKKEGWKKWRNRKSLLDNISNEFAKEIGLKDGKNISGTEALILKLKNTLIGNNLNKINLQQANLALRFLEILTPKESNIDEYDDENKENKGNKTKLGYVEFCVASEYDKPYAKQEEMVDFAFNGGTRLLLGSRGYGKTDYITILGIAYHLYLDNLKTFILITKEKIRGNELVAEIRRCLENVGVKFQNKSLTRIRIKGLIKKEPNLVSLSLRSKRIRGKHVDYIICDDMITPDDCSNAERERVKKVYEELQKLSKQGKTNITIIGQPVHPKDLYSELRGLSSIEKLEIRHGEIPELDHDLEAQRLAGVSEASIKASYFLEIEADLTMPFFALKELDFFPSTGAVAFIDPSSKGNDWTAISVASGNFENIIFCGFAFKRSWDNCLEEIMEICQILNVKKIFFETNGLGNYPVRVLKKNGLEVVGWHTTENKHSKIMNAGMFRDFIRLANLKFSNPILKDANLAYIKQVKEYDYNAQYDDSPDSLASTLQVMGLIGKREKNKD
ncbi:MAG: hypothetical protein LBF97_00755 [Elusimicrobiota bacterium]|jgi:hypothetical protein|nr:hypothetical protein [Elusimicrobiota bacterium]